MQVLIVEDETLAAKNLKSMLLQIDDSIEVLDICPSIESTVKWLKTNSQPDLIFMDIQLADGLSFDIFNRVTIDCPVIFTTAYDEYALQAFKVNSIDYLLKPLDPEQIKISLKKYQKLQRKPDSDKADLGELLKNIKQSFENNQPVYRSRFLVKASNSSMIKIKAEEVAYFYLDNKLAYLVGFNGKDYMTDYNLEDLERELDPRFFFRLNRQFIAHIDSILAIHKFFDGKLKVDLKPQPKETVTVSRLKANDFKEWLDR